MNDELTGAMYIGSVVINKSLTKCRTEETEIIIQLAINKVGLGQGRFFISSKA